MAYDIADFSPVIFGMSGTRLTQQEKEFFTKIHPYGYILFARNCDNPNQIKSLIAELRAISGRGDDLPVLIDQEGGRVARLKPPHFPEFPPADYFAKIAESDLEQAKKAVFENAKKIAEMLRELGITVNCAPLADVPIEGAHNIIGDRAFGKNPEQVAILARAFADGQAAGGVISVLKHIPGHGRAFADSHLELPVVDTPLDELRATDFVPFKKLADLPMAMTAHVLFTAIDRENMATTSAAAIRLIREEIGFTGLLMSDDLSMKAMRGNFRERAKSVLAAGCDLILHCNGDMQEMQEITSGIEEFVDSTRKSSV